MESNKNKRGYDKICSLLEKGYSGAKIQKILKDTGNKIRLLIYEIRYRKQWTHISVDYNWELDYHDNKETTNELIHNICILIEKGFSNKDICKKLNVSSNIASKVRSGKRHKGISKLYNFNRERFHDYRKDDIYDVDLDDEHIYSISGILMTLK